MTATTWAWSEDFGPAWVRVILAVGVVAIAVLLWELRRREQGGLPVILSGLLATLALVAAALRPVSIETRGSTVGARIVVLVDGSRRLLLPGRGGGSRRAVAERSVTELRRHFGDARLTVLEFGDDALVPFAPDATPAAAAARRWVDSDLVGALRAASRESAERPAAVIVVSDGRLTRPSGELEDAALRASVGDAEVPIHTVSVVDHAPPDASLRRADAAGAVVAHQPFELRVQVACVGGLRCDAIPVRVRELRQGADPALLASGRAVMNGDSAEIALSVTLERAGDRVLEIAIDAPPGDTVPENDRRFLSFDVARDRVRLLHVAGRPGYDARALRNWLKADESVDLIAFFILRNDFDDVRANESELALIRFPVDELFTEHLGSFDAVILQDIDAVTYKLARHLAALARYVEGGGGLIMVGGPSSFAGGQYGATDLERVLPVTIGEARQYFDAADFVPRYSDAGRAAPILRGLRDLHGEALPVMPGANLVGAARPNAIVLWEHPTIRVAGAAMPVLAIGEAGDGRAIALGVDGTHRLGFGQFAANAGGRSYGAAWDGLLGWLMRDPRFEPARMKLADPCLADVPLTLEIVPMPGAEGEVEVTIERLGAVAGEPLRGRASAASKGVVAVPFAPLPPGGYVARARIGASPPVRFDFACERGGAAFSDVRPDSARLARVAALTGGRAVTSDRIGSLPRPAPVTVAAERHVAAWLPAWVWAAGAAILLGAHWLARRRSGLA